LRDRPPPRPAQFEYQRLSQCQFSHVVLSLKNGGVRQAAARD
jgi:hypothetical protein